MPANGPLPDIQDGDGFPAGTVYGQWIGGVQDTPTGVNY